MKSVIEAQRVTQRRKTKTVQSTMGNKGNVRLPLLQHHKWVTYVIRKTNPTIDSKIEQLSLTG